MLHSTGIPVDSISLTRHTCEKNSAPMAFLNSVIPYAVTILQPGSCQAVRVTALLDQPVPRAEISREEHEAKQSAYQRQRAEWLELMGVKNTN